MTGNLFDFNGSDYVPYLDQQRLTGQINRIFQLMSDEKWRTLSEIARITKDGEASVSAQLRNLKKERFGSHTILRRRTGLPENGLFEYKIEK